MTKMLKRSDVIALVMKEITFQWDIVQKANDEGEKHRALHSRSRIDELRWVRAAIHKLPTWVEKEYASDDVIPIGAEWSERVRLAGEMSDAPNDADPSMLRLLADLRTPLDELQRQEAELKA